MIYMGEDCAAAEQCGLVEPRIIVEPQVLAHTGIMVEPYGVVHAESHGILVIADIGKIDNVGVLAEPVSVLAGYHEILVIADIGKIDGVLAVLDLGGRRALLSRYFSINLA